MDEYDLNGMSFPVVRDFIHGERCALELNKNTLPYLPFSYDVIFTGAKRTDTSDAVPVPFKSEKETFGNITFIQPLYHWTDEEVRAKAQELGIPFSKERYADGDETYDTGNLSACHNCLHEGGYCHIEDRVVPRIEWDRQASLTAFQTKYGFV